MAKTTKIENCYNSGTIKGNGYAGGIAARYEEIIRNGATVQNCYNTGELIKSGSGGDTGGIVGSGEYVSIEKCYNAGNVTNGYQSGGIIGYGNECKVLNCYNKANVIGKNNSYNGGICGYSYNATIENSYNAGNVGFVDKQYTGYVAGIIAGGGPSVLKHTYNFGNINENQKTANNQGAIAGYISDGTIEKNYYLKGTFSAAVGGKDDVTGQYESIEKKEDMLTKIITDLVTANPTIWVTDETGKNGGYPVLNF